MQPNNQVQFIVTTRFK